MQKNWSSMGLSRRALLAAMALPGCAATLTDVPEPDRVDCGFVNISQRLCAARGCLFADVPGQTPDGPPACYYAAAGVPITKVHVVFSNHVDVGYTDLVDSDGAERDLAAGVAPSVVAEYFSSYFPRAAAVGAALRAARNESLQWMTQSWLVNLFLDCPAGLGLRCPNATQIAAVEAAIAAGDITWHAFPHNSQLSLASPALVRELVAHTHGLDDKLGRPRKRVLSQRDVPGLPRGVVPALTAAGVDAVSVGSNGRVLPPNVPPAFRWRDAGAAPPGGVPASGAELLVLWHPYGYGGSKSDGVAYSRSYTRLPGHPHLLYYAWKGDNEGPPSLAEVEARFAEVRALFPAADVRASSLDAFVAGVPEDLLLPVVTADLEDTWIQGAAQAPATIKKHKALRRAFDACARNEASCAPDRGFYDDIFSDDAVAAFSRLFSKNIEHSFGLSLPKFSPAAVEYGSYGNDVFHAAFDGATYALYRQSWAENDAFGFDGALAALGDAPLKKYVDDELARLSTPAGVVGDRGAFTPIALGEAATLGGWLRVAAGPRGLAACVDLRSNRSWADASRPFAAVAYQTLVDGDFAEFRESYLWEGAYGAGHEEYGRPNATKDAGAASAFVEAAAVEAYATADALLVRLSLEDAALHESYGAPSDIWLRVDAASPGVADVSVSLANKTATRFPEAMYLSFDVRGAWWLEKLERWLDPTETVIGASRNLHAADAAAVRAADGAGIVFRTLETALALFPGAAGPAPFPDVYDVDTSRGVAFPLLANCFWNTNYPSFLPFHAIHGDYAFRFSLEFT